MNGKRFKIGCHSEQEVGFLIKLLHLELADRPLGSKLVNRQRNGLIQGSRQIEHNAGDPNNAISSSSDHASPSATSTDLSIWKDWPVSSTAAVPWSPDPAVDNCFIVVLGIPTIEAFMCIATTLELLCMQDTGFNIGAVSSTLPPALVPTLQQQIVPHRPYVDMVPWSSMRDRLLNSTAAISEIEFVHDMWASDIKVWGATPCDPMSWEVGSDFAKKWWFFIDEGLIKTSNFWRSQRGEDALVLPAA